MVTDLGSSNNDFCENVNTGSGGAHTHTVSGNTGNHTLIQQIH